MSSKAFEGATKPVSEPTLTKEASFHRGLKAATAGDTEAALEHFHAQLKETPDHYGARLHLAKAFKRLKRMEEAAEAFTAILHQTQSAEPALELSRIALHETDYDTAEEMIRLALERDPGQSQIKTQSEAVQKARKEHAFRLGIRAATAGDTEAALEHFHAQLKETPDHYEARLHLAKAFKRLKRMEEAAEAFTAILHQTQSAEPALELSRIALHETDYDTAEEMARLALERNPGQSQIKTQSEAVQKARKEHAFRLGIRAATTGDTEAALEHFHAQLKETPDHYEARLHLAKAFKRLKRMEEAAEAFTAILHQTQSAEPALELSRIALHETDYDTAEEMARLALERNPGQSQIKTQSEAVQKARKEHAFRLGIRAATAGDTEAALEHFHAQLKETPDHYEARLHLAKAFKRLKRMEEAAEAFTAILHQTQSAEPALELSRIALHETDYDTAEEMARLALERDPGQNQIRARLVRILLQRKDFTEASRHATALLESAEDPVLGHACLAICAYASGDTEGGAQTLEQACAAATKTDAGYQTISKLLKDSSIPAAVAKFIDLTSQTHPDLVDVSLWDLKARYLKQQGESEKAIFAYVQAIRKSPSRREFYIEVARLLSGIAQDKARNDVITTPEREVALDFLSAAYAGDRKNSRVLAALFDYHLKARTYDRAWRYLSELEQAETDPQQTAIRKVRFFLAQGHWQDALHSANLLEHSPKPTVSSWKSVAKARETFGNSAQQEAALHNAIAMSDPAPDLLVQHARALYELGSFRQARDSHTQARERARQKGQALKDLPSLDVLITEASADLDLPSFQPLSTTGTLLASDWMRWETRWNDEDWLLLGRGWPADADGAALAAPLLAEHRSATGYLYACPAGSLADPVTWKAPQVNTCTLFACRRADLERLAQSLATDDTATLLSCLTRRLQGQYVPNVAAPPPASTGLGGDPISHQTSANIASRHLGADQVKTLLQRGEDHLRAEVLSTGIEAAVFTADTARSATTLSDCRLIRTLYLDQVPSSEALPGAVLAHFDRIIPASPEVQAWLEDHHKLSSSVATDPDSVARQDLQKKHGRTLIVVGAGIGNILQATPLIRHLSEQLGEQVDVLLRSGVPVAAELFSDSPYVRHAFTDTARVRDLAYDRAFVTQSAGAVIPFINSKQFLVQRRSFDMFDRCRFMHEAEFNFLGSERLFPELSSKPPSPLPGPFVRAHTMDGYARPDRGSRPPVVGLVSSVPTDPLFAKRSWPHYAELVAKIQAKGWQVRSFGLPPEFIEGSENRTGIPFRQMISEVSDCDVFVTTDTGAFHVAEATGVPTVVMWGPSSTIKNGPLSPRTLQLFSKRECAPCQFKLDFLLCDDPVCMQDITPNQVVEAVDDLLTTPGSRWEDLSESCRTHETTHLSSPFRADFTARYSRLADQVLSDMKDLFDRLLSGHIATGQLDRADKLLNRFLPTDTCTLTQRLLHARLAFEVKDYNSTLTHLAAAAPHVDGADQVIWLELRTKAQRRLHQYTELAQTWFDLPAPLQATLSDRPGSAVVALQHIAFGLARCGYTADAEKAYHSAIALKPDKREEISLWLKQLDDSLSRHLSPRRPLLQEDRIKWAVVTDTAADLARIPLPRHQVETFWYRPHETDALERDRAHLDIISDTTTGDIGRHDLPGQDLHSDSWTAAAQTQLDALAVLQTTSPSKRIMIFCHHHPFRWNPRGGERSTRTIAKALQDDGYDILFVVENKKTSETFCEIYDGCAVMLAGQLRFRDTCLGAIACWRPDLAIMYGETSLRASAACRQSGLNYIMFPRDWGEITPAAPQDLLSLSPDEAVTQEYRDLYTGAWRTLTNCDYAGTVLQHFYGIETQTAYVPVERPENRDRYNPAGPVLLINPAKGGGEALLQDLARNMPETAFRVIGGEPKQFPANVEVLPFHDGPYEEMYDGVSLTLFPFGGMEACGTGRVVLESFHCGVPVLASASGGIPEAVPEKWLISDDTNIQQWIDGIRHALDQGPQDLEPHALLTPFLPESSLEVACRAVSEYFRDHKTRDFSTYTQSGQ